MKIRIDWNDNLLPAHKSEWTFKIRFNYTDQVVLYGRF